MHRETLDFYTCRLGKIVRNYKKKTDCERIPDDVIFQNTRKNRKVESELESDVNGDEREILFDDSTSTETFSEFEKTDDEDINTETTPCEILDSKQLQKDMFVLVQIVCEEKTALKLYVG